MSWEKVYLKEILQIKNGKDHKKLKEGNYPVYGSGGIIRYVNQYLYDKKSVLLPRKGTLNNIQYVEKPFWTVDTCYYTEIDENKVNPYFLYRNLRQFDIEALNTGSAIPSMTFDKYYSIQIMIPSMEIQNKIANILSAYDYLIENNQKQIKLLEEAAQRLYKEWFVDLRFPGYEDTEIIDGVPEAWKKERVKNVIGKVIRSKQIKASEYLKKGLIPIIDQSRDFIAGYTNDNESVVKMDKPVIVFGDHTRILKYIQFPFAKGADGTQLIISNEENLPQSLLYLSLQAVDLSNYHYARHFKYLKEELIFVPTKQVSDEFDKIITPVLVQIQKLRDTSTKAVEARDRLLPKLMNGELEV